MLKTSKKRTSGTRQARTANDESMSLETSRVLESQKNAGGEGDRILDGNGTVPCTGNRKRRRGLLSFALRVFAFCGLRSAFWVLGSEFTTECFPFAQLLL